MKDFFKKLFSFTNRVRVVIFNLIFWIIIGVGLYALFSGSTPTEKGNILDIDFYGYVVDSPETEDLMTILKAGGEVRASSTILRDVLRALELAIDDEKIKYITLDLDSSDGMGYGAIEEIGSLIDKFKATGRKVFAYSSFYNQSKYLLASYADSVIMDPMGDISIDGISVYRNYLKDALDKLGVSVNVFRSGKYKSYVEPYISNSMSKEVKEQNLLWINSIWDDVKYRLVKNRPFDIGVLEEFTTNRVGLINLYNNSYHRMILDKGFVDGESSFDEFFYDDFNLYSGDSYLEENIFYNYLDYIRDNTPILEGNNIGVITIEGAISESDNSSGSVSAYEIVELINSADFDDSLLGVIIRINSGGGGVFASELIRRAVVTLAETKPVVISMGDVCASGGYWIASAGDYIFADSSTITGSIGVFGLTYSGEGLLNKYFDVHNDGVSTTPYFQGDLTKNMSPEMINLNQVLVDDTYNEFVSLVAISRGLKVENIKANIAGGRVWSGAQAKELNLVDQLGGLLEAKKYLENRISIEDSNLVYLDSSASMLDQVLTSLLKKANVQFDIKIPNAIESLTIFERINDPKNIYAMW